MRGIKPAILYSSVALPKALRLSPGLEAGARKFTIELLRKNRASCRRPGAAGQRRVPPAHTNARRLINDARPGALIEERHCTHDAFGEHHLYGIGGAVKHLFKGLMVPLRNGRKHEA